MSHCKKLQQMKAHTRQRFKSVCGIKTKLTKSFQKKDSCMLFFYPFETLFSHLSIKRWIGSFVFIDFRWSWLIDLMSLMMMALCFLRGWNAFLESVAGFSVSCFVFCFFVGRSPRRWTPPVLYIYKYPHFPFFEKVTQPNSPLISPTRNHIQQPLYASSHQEKVIQNWMKARAGREEEENGRRQKTLNPMTISQSNY